MLDKKIAKYALSMSWRFMLSGMLVMFLLLMILPLNMSQEEIIANPYAGFIHLVAEIIWIYATMYLTLFWISHSSKQDERRAS